MSASFQGSIRATRDRGRKPVCARLDGFGWNALAGAARLIYNGVVPERLERGRCPWRPAPSSGVLSRGDGRGDGGIADSPQRHRDEYPGAVRLVASPEPAAPPPRGWRGRRTTRLEAMVRDAGLTDRVHFWATARTWGRYSGTRPM